MYIEQVNDGQHINKSLIPIYGITNLIELVST
jgi:hypothetical protein